MVRMRNMRSTAYLACLLILALYVAPPAVSAAALTGRQRLVVFPFSSSAGVMQAGMGEKMAAAVVEQLQGSAEYDASFFSKRHPSLQRAVMVERTMSEKDLSDSYGAANRDTALKIAREIRADLILIGDIETYKFDSAKTQSEVLLNAEVIDVRTGKTVKNMAIAGRTPENSKPVIEADAASLAEGDAVAKVAQELGVKPRSLTGEVVRTSTARKKSNRSRVLLTLLLGLGLGLAVSGGDSGGTTTTSGGDPPIPGDPTK